MRAPAARLKLQVSKHVPPFRRARGGLTTAMPKGRVSVSHEAELTLRRAWAISMDPKKQPIIVSPVKDIENEAFALLSKKEGWLGLMVAGLVPSHTKSTGSRVLTKSKCIDMMRGKLREARLLTNCEEAQQSALDALALDSADDGELRRSRRRMVETGT